ncbi:MAG TPA: N-acetylmuramic acid 6-phosphate etherase [Chthoniobacteraceae bacterium]
MESPKRILGIEGGGTKTEWLVLAVQPDGFRIEARGSLPASNLRLTSDEALRQLFSVLPREVTHVGAFLAGCATGEDRVRLRRLVTEAWPNARLAVGSDRDSGLATAFRAADGIAVIAGTGAAVHGRRGSQIEKAGGWGQLLGDRGGGYDLAMQGLRLVLTHYDLNQKITPLAEEILRSLALNRLQDLVGWAMQADKMSVARLAPAIFRAAKYGEPEMLATVQAGANVLAEYTRAVAQRLHWPTAQVKLIGGLFAHHPEYAGLFKYRLSILLPEANVETCVESGAMGAAWLAAEDLPDEIATSAPAVPDSLEELAAASTEQSNPRSAALETLSTAELVDLFVSEEDRVAAALAERRAELVAAVDTISAAMCAGGRLFYLGAGTSGRLGVLDASEIPPTFGAPPEQVQGVMAGGAPALHRAVEGAEDQPAAGALAVLERGVRAGDVVCGLTASGRTPFVLGGLAKARELGARTLLVSCNPRRRASAQPWDVELDLPTGPELITGSTRLKAGTATKVTLNLLSTCAMIRLGRVRGNTMVDLNISNEKLRDRGTRVVSAMLNLPYADARRRLEAAGWNVRRCLDEAGSSGSAIPVPTEGN